MPFYANFENVCAVNYTWPVVSVNLSTYHLVMFFCHSICTQNQLRPHTNESNSNVSVCSFLYNFTRSIDCRCILSEIITVMSMDQWKSGNRMKLSKLQLLVAILGFIAMNASGTFICAQSTTQEDDGSKFAESAEENHTIGAKNATGTQLNHASWVMLLNHVGGAITVNCAERGDDLGIHDLLNAQEYYFDFDANYWGTTLYWCNFLWQQRKAHVVVWSGPGFLGLDPVPCTHCLWDVRPEGFWRAESGQRARLVQAWVYP